jgi:hypothetical protein
MDYHKTQCYYEWINCEFCQEKMQKKDLLHHLNRFKNNNMCSEYPYRCDGCCKKIPIKFLARHAMQECRKRNTVFNSENPLEIGMIVDIKNVSSIWMKYLIVGKQDMDGIFYCVLLVGDNQFLTNIKTMRRCDVQVYQTIIRNEPFLLDVKDLYGIACIPKHPKTVDIKTGESHTTVSRWTQNQECYCNGKVVASCEIIQSFPNFYRIRFQGQDFYIHRTRRDRDDVYIELKIGQVYTILYNHQYYEPMELETIMNGNLGFKDLLNKSLDLTSIPLTDCIIYPFNFCQ